MRYRLAGAVCASLAWGVLGCGDGASPWPRDPVLEVTTRTTGDDLDPDGYWATLDWVDSVPIGLNDAVTFSGFNTGRRNVALQDVRWNCAVDGLNPRLVELPATGPLTVEFRVVCADYWKDGIVAHTRTYGIQNLDPPYHWLFVDSTFGSTVPLTGVNMLVGGLARGSEHLVEVWFLNPRCTVDSGPARRVTMTADTNDVYFNFWCF